MTSGSISGLRPQHENGEEAVFRVLNRDEPVLALDSLIAALEPPEKDWSVSGTVVALDTNVILRLQGHAKSEDIVDYLVSKHDAPIILPGQVLTEFWNNLAAVNTIAKELKGDFTKFEKRVQGLDKRFRKFSKDLEKTLGDFQNEFGSVYGAEAVRKTGSLLQSIQGRAIVPFVSRVRFQQLAEHRRNTQTPPGFEDVRHGDFFVWSDFLLGLMIACSSGKTYERTVFVTNEKKKDWVRNDVAHPVLTAEAKAVSGLPFAIWSLDTLADRLA